MDQSEYEIQLNVWKDLAVSKQVLIGAATDALGLDAECSTEELRNALNVATKRAKDADERVKSAKAEARNAIGEMERKMVAAENARNAADQARDEATLALETAEKQLVAERLSSADEVKKIKSELAEQKRNIKAINVALADTPENVVKKLKALKKQKLDEANSKKRVETELRSMKKEKQKLEIEVKEKQELINSAAELAESSEKMHEMLTEAEVNDVPEINAETIKALNEAKESKED